MAELWKTDVSSAGELARSMVLGVAGGSAWGTTQYVFTHSWGRPEIPQAVAAGTAVGVLAAVPTGNVFAALAIGAMVGAGTLCFAHLGLRARRRSLPAPPTSHTAGLD